MTPRRAAASSNARHKNFCQQRAPVWGIQKPRGRTRAPGRRSTMAPIRLLGRNTPVSSAREEGGGGSCCGERGTVVVRWCGVVSKDSVV